MDRSLEKEFLKVCDQVGILECVVGVRKGELNISFRYFVKLLPFLISYYKDYKPSKKLTTTLS